MNLVLASIFFNITWITSWKLRKQFMNDKKLQKAARMEETELEL